MGRNHMDDMAELLSACFCYVGSQRRLVDRLAETDDPATLAITMTAELDQLAAALRQALAQRLADGHPQGPR